jgi:predicted nucleotidyltransferase
MINDSRIYSVINPLVIKYPGIIRIGVFGSYARKKKKNRDIDIVFEESPDNDVIDILQFLSDLTEGIKIQMHKKSDILSYKAIVTPKNDEVDEEIRQNILKDLVWIYEKA